MWLVLFALATITAAMEGIWSPAPRWTWVSDRYDPWRKRQEFSPWQAQAG